jgi:hypothetical protein
VAHGGNDDLACAPIFAGAAANGAPETVTGARPAAQPQHCLLCHWSRWIRSDQTNRSDAVAPCEPSARLIPAVLLVEAHCHYSLRPGRAPPA